MLDPIFSRTRQKRLLQILQERRLDAALIGLSKHVYYFTAHLPFWQNYAGLLLFADGRSLLLTANSPDANAAADDVQPYDATWNGTQRQEQPALIASQLMERIRERHAMRIGIDASPVTAAAAGLPSDANLLPIDSELWQLRRQKDRDELKLMKVGIDCCRAMYERARRIIAPGVPELRIYAELHQVAIETAGEPLSDYLGTDYACGAIGGPPRKGRVASAGELYILDLGPAFRGYFSDNARTFSVDRKPTDAQLKAWEVVTGIHPIIERIARPGVRCRELYAAADEHYRSHIGKPFPHHLGHGVGLQPHEFPHLNPKWDDTLLEGEIFTVEPGLYGPELGGGMRLENQYRVTQTGLENLTPFPMELA